MQKNLRETLDCCSQRKITPIKVSLYVLSECVLVYEFMQQQQQSCGDLTVEGVEADEATLTGLPCPVPLPGRAK